MNSVVLIGRLARDPELSYTPSNTAMCKFTIAVDRPKRNGEDQGADFLRITVFGKQGENCDRFLSKGRQVAIAGRIQTGSYKNKEGVTVYTTDIIADRVEFLGSGQSNQDGRGQNRQQRPQQASQQGSQYGGQYNDQYGGQYNDQYNGQYNDQYGGQQQFAPNAFDASAFDDMPDTFQAAEDDIPF